MIVGLHRTVYLPILAKLEEMVDFPALRLGRFVAEQGPHRREHPASEHQPLLGADLACLAFANATSARVGNCASSLRREARFAIRAGIIAP